MKNVLNLLDNEQSEFDINDVGMKQQHLLSQIQRLMFNISEF